MIDKNATFKLRIYEIKRNSLKKLDAEKIALGIFKKENYKLISDNRNYGSFLKGSRTIRFSSGIPDFTFLKDGKEIYVEVKTNKDGLRFEQLNWITNNPKKEIIIFFIKQNFKKGIIDKEKDRINWLKQRAKLKRMNETKEEKKKRFLHDLEKL